MSKRLESGKKKPSQPVTPTAVISAPGTQTNGTIAKETIQQLAYQKWEAAGKPCCDGTTFWEQAEKELLQQK